MAKAGLDASIIGLGCEHLVDHSYDELEPIIRTAIDNGINIFDVFMAQPDVRSNIGRALGGNRKKVLLQGHIGSILKGNQPAQSRETKIFEPFFEDFMKRMNTDYVDIGFLHFIDREDDYRVVFEGQVIEYALKLKQKGTIRAIGLSTHSEDIALKAVKTGLVDVIMFPVNPAFDLMPKEQDIFDIYTKEAHHTENWYCMELVRQELYFICEKMGTSIVTMKTLAGGMLLQQELSPFGKAMSVSQCIHYVLSNPVVASAMIGCRSVSEVENMLEYINADNDQKDYLSILSNAPIEGIKGKCMYCNHCLPCPSSIDIATVTKYLDIVSVTENKGLGVINDYYRSLERNASHCIECGNCESKCPFDVKVINNMKRAQEIFA